MAKLKPLNAPAAQTKAPAVDPAPVKPKRDRKSHGKAQPKPAKKSKTKAAPKAPAPKAKPKGPGGRPRKGEEGNTLTAQQPWLAMGIGERTYYRRKAAGTLGEVSPE